MKPFQWFYSIAVALAVVAGAAGCAKKVASAPAPAPVAELRAEAPAPIPPPMVGRPEYQAPPPEIADQRQGLVRVYFAADRTLTGNTAPAKVFGNGRSKQIYYGTCVVSIPKNHLPGELETPLFGFTFLENSKRHVVLRRTTIQDKGEYFRELAERVKASKDSSAFLFVHGYNVTFSDAARRTAQIAYDLNFDGAPVFYSWPSQGRTDKYFADEQNVEWTQTHVKDFLRDFINTSQAKNIYLIAHSMGNRALTRALSELYATELGVRDKIKEIILAAPDIDAQVFEEVIAPGLRQGKAGITLYVSSKDRALMASKGIHDKPRAGDSGKGPVVMSGIETIDATTQDTGFLGHSYIVEERPLLGDLHELIKGLRADQRFGLEAVDCPAGRYWQFRPGR